MSHETNRPDYGAMEQLFENNQSNVVGTALRLAWLEGLSRDEIIHLTWPDISMERKLIQLKDRSIPFFGDMEECLRKRVTIYGRMSPNVIISDKFQHEMRPEALSRLLRKTLDEAGLYGISISNLRADFIIRHLETEDWAYVARISGLCITALQAKYAKYIQVRTPPKTRVAGNDEYDIWKLLQAEKGTMEGLALSLRWYMDVQLTEMTALTWDQVDFENNMLHLRTRELKLVPSVKELLLMEQKRRREGEDPHVLLTEKRRKPLDVPYLSKRIRTCMIQGGVENILFRDFHRTTEKDVAKVKILTMAKSKHGLARNDVIKKLALSPLSAHRLLHELVTEQELIRFDLKYYLPGTIVPPEEMESTVLTYLREHGTATIIDLHLLLRIDRKQCSHFLQKMVDEGKLNHKGQRYILPEKN